MGNLDKQTENGQLKTVEKVQMSYREKILTSCAVWYCTFTLGVGISFLGSSLLELSVKFDTDVATLSKVFTVLTCAFLVGAIISGVVFNHVNRQLACTVLLFLMGIATICFPLAPSIAVFFSLAGLCGFAGAGYDTAQIVWVIELWERAAAPYIQTQHFIFAIGTFVSPLLMKPFLSDLGGEEDVVEIGKGAELDLKLINGSSIQGAATNRTEYLILGGEDVGTGVETVVASPSPTLFIPFLIGGLFSIAGGLLLLIMYCIKPYVKPEKIAEQQQRENGGSGGERRRSSTGGRAKSCNFKKILLICLSAFMLGAYTGMEMCSIQFLPSFTHFVLGLSARHGTVILSGLTGAFTVGRGIGIVVVLKVLPEILLLTNIILIIIGNSILYFFAHKSLAALWGGSICLGLGFSTVFPSFYGYIERHLRISNFVGACMIVGGGGISSMYPLIIGGWIQTNPFVLMYTNYFSIFVCITAFTSIFVITKRDAAKAKERSVRGSMRSNGNANGTVSAKEREAVVDYSSSTDTESTLKP